MRSGAAAHALRAVEVLDVAVLLEVGGDLRALAHDGEELELLACRS